LAQNFGRTIGVISHGVLKNDTSLRQRLDDIMRDYDFGGSLGY
jgi:hypothetical protein